MWGGKKEKVDAQESAELSIPWHHSSLRRIARRAGEHLQRPGHDTFGIRSEEIDTRAPMDIGMAAGTDGDEERYGKTSELAVRAVHKGTGANGG